MKTTALCSATVVKACLGICLAIGLTLGGCHKDSKHPEEAEQTPSYDVAQVVVDSVTLTKDYPGTLKANVALDLMVQVEGNVTSLPFKSGSKVAKGAVLCTLDPTKYSDAVQQAAASLETANATYDYASRQYEAMKKALESDAVSQMDVIQAKSNLDQAKASISNAKAALATAQKTLSYCTVRAPFDGTVTNSPLDVGGYVSGPTRLLTIYDDTSLQAVFSVEDIKYYEIIEADKAGTIDLNNVPIVFDGLDLEHQYTGQLSYVDPAVNTETGTITLKVKVMNPYSELKSGMYCQVRVPYGSSKNAMLVKDASIGSDQLGKYLYCVNDSNKVVYTHIEVGELANDSMRIVTSGLQPGARYVTKALLKVRPGETIKPVMTK